VHARAKVEKLIHTLKANPVVTMNNKDLKKSFQDKTSVKHINESPFFAPERETQD